jgi:hypothetical protein
MEVSDVFHKLGSDSRLGCEANQIYLPLLLGYTPSPHSKIESKVARKTEVARRSDLDTAPRLRHPHIQHHYPVLKRLQRKSAQNEHNAKRSQSSLWQIVGKVFDQRNHRAAHSGHNADH